MARVDDQFRSPPRHSNSDFNDLGCRFARLLVGHLWFSPHANLVGLFILNDGHYLPRLLVSPLSMPNETWMGLLRSILRNYSVSFAHVPHNRPTNAESWEIPFSREGLAFLGEIAQLKVRDARSISPPGLGEVE